MKNLKYLWYLATTLLIIQFVGCDDEWDKHYNTVSSDKIDMKITEYIKSKPEWSIFSQMLEKTGYDSVLNSNLTYTVWVPENSALENVDINDDESVKRVVEGHIARFSFSTSGVSSERIFMLSEKYNEFYESGQDYKLNDATLKTKNALLLNGFVHSISRYVPFIPNIWQYLGNTVGLDSLGKFAYAQEIKVFNPYGSTQIGEVDGVPLYDSAFNESNIIRTILGDLNEEDSLYTVILPKNSAWLEGYKKLKDLFVISEDEGGEEMQDYITGLIMLKDLSFRGVIEDPETKDSLKSTIGNYMTDPARLFSYTEKVKLSNGYAYLADSFNVSLAEAGYKTLTIEAEWSSNVETSNCEVTSKSSVGTGVNLSNDGFLDVTFTGSKFSGAAVTFPIPSTLSTTYNIYCVFVPFNLEGGDIKDQVKAKFSLTYEDQNGNSKSVRLYPENEITDSTSVTKMLLGQFEFPVANLQVDPEERSETKVYLEVKNNYTDRTIKDGFSLDMRIDAIILEPVE